MASEGAHNARAIVCCACLFRRGTRALIVGGPWICPTCDRKQEQRR